MKKFPKQRGFTLIEIMTALALFLVVMTISMGSIVSIFDADRKSRSLRSVMGNLNLALETMSREMRFGSNYHCGPGNISAPRNCPSGDTIIGFLNSENVQVVYRKNGTAIERSTDGGATYGVVTAPEIIIDDLIFYTLGTGTNNSLQPKTLIKVRGRAGKGNAETDFTLQTLVSQRAIDR